MLFPSRFKYFLIPFCNNNNRRLQRARGTALALLPCGALHALPSRAITLHGVVCSGEQW